MGDGEPSIHALERLAGEFERAVYSELDAMSPDEVARDWAWQATSPQGTRDGMAIYHLYTLQQPHERGEAIRRRFGYLTSLEGTTELQRVLADREVIWA